MSAGGWIPAWRKMYEPEHWLAPTKRDPSNRRDAWVDLCQMATRCARETASSGTLERAEIVASLRTLGERWRWSKDRVKRFMSELEVRTAIETVRETPDGTVYRIVKYDTYAPSANGQRDTKRDTKRDRGETAARQEQEVKKTATTYSSDFEEVWSVCRRGSKRQALHYYRRAVPSDVSHEDLLAAWTSYVGAASSPEYVAHLFRWIRDERWNDQPPDMNNSGGLARPRLSA